jgi:predicted permease
MIVSIFGNTSFVGFSYIESLYGADYLGYALVYDQLGSFVVLLTFGMILISWGGKKSLLSKETLKDIFLSPPLIAIILAIFLKDITFPIFLESILDKLQATLIPLVTIIVGMKLEFKGIAKSFKESIIALFIKMFLVPFVMFWILDSLFDLSWIWLQVTLIETAMPPMTMAVVYAIRGKLNKDLAINSLALGILVSFFSILLLYQLFNY